MLLTGLEKGGLGDRERWGCVPIQSRSFKKENNRIRSYGSIGEERVTAAGAGSALPGVAQNKPDARRPGGCCVSPHRDY